MSIFFRILIFTVLICVSVSLFPAPLFAEEPCTINSAQDILNCALRKHPDVLNAQAEKNRDENLVKIAKQRQNPELEGRLLPFSNIEDRTLNSEAALLYTVELGGKRRARMGQAKAEVEQSANHLLQSQEETALQTVLALYRLRQIEAELSRVDESISTFDKIMSSYSTRPQLSPEQEVSRTSFDLAREEYRLTKTSLIQEQSNLAYWLELVTENSYEHLQQYLPPLKSQWPQLQAGQAQEPVQNSSTAAARSEQKLADSNLKLARAKAWPDVKIGPALETETLASDTNVFGGVGFSLPLPLVSLNRGEKAYAKADKARADTNLAITLQKNSLERRIQLKRYETAIAALKQSASLAHLSTQHEKIELYFERGLVSSPLVIESHRQLYEITKTRNEQELGGVGSLWRLYIIDGKILDAKI